MCVASNGSFLPSPMELPASPVDKCWENIETDCIYVKAHHVINLFQASIMYLSWSDFVLWVSCKMDPSGDPEELPVGTREVIWDAAFFVCVQ